MSDDISRAIGEANGFRVDRDEPDDELAYASGCTPGMVTL